MTVLVTIDGVECHTVEELDRAVAAAFAPLKAALERATRDTEDLLSAWLSRRTLHGLLQGRPELADVSIASRALLAVSAA